MGRSWLTAAPCVLALCLSLPRFASASCAGDCNGDNSVTVDEILVSVGIALGAAGAAACHPADIDHSGGITIDEILVAIAHALESCPPVPTPSPTATPSATPTPTISASVPTEGGALLAWLRAGNYLGWRAESRVHRTGGPHGGDVRTFVNDIAYVSLEAGNAAHPAGSALVKELYTGGEVRLWAVMVKVQDDSAGGNGWYWWEGASFDGLGEPLCVGCHRANYRQFVSKDFVLSPFPLQ